MINVNFLFRFLCFAKMWDDLSFSQSTTLGIVVKKCIFHYTFILSELYSVLYIHHFNLLTPEYLCCVSDAQSFRFIDRPVEKTKTTTAKRCFGKKKKKTKNKKKRKTIFTNCKKYDVLRRPSHFPIIKFIYSVYL